MTQKVDSQTNDEEPTVQPTPTTSAPAAVPVPVPAAAPAIVPSAAVAQTEESSQDAEAAPPKPEPGATAVPSTTAPAVEPTSKPEVKPDTEAATPVTAPSESKEEEEPQNPLTQKFTAAEWKALKELRAQVPTIVKDAYSDNPGDKPTQTLSLNMWSVPIYPDVKDARASVILVKFLRARNLNPTEAGEMLKATIRWRAIFKVDELANEEFSKDVFGNLGHLYGVDREGHPVVYNLYGGNRDLKAVFGDVPLFIRWRVKLMEECVAKLDFVNVDQMIQVHDYAGVSMRDRDANSKNAASEASNIFQNHYPEFLARKFFINVPSLLSWIFWLFKSVVSARTFAKMSVVGSGQHEINKALSEIIDEKEIPKRYGGLAEGF